MITLTWHLLVMIVVTVLLLERSFKWIISHSHWLFDEIEVKWGLLLIMAVLWLIYGGIFLW